MLGESRGHPAAERSFFAACISMLSVLSCSRDRILRQQGYRRYLQWSWLSDCEADLPIVLMAHCQAQMDQIESAASLDDLRAPPGNRLERLRGDRRGQRSVRINERYRICFHWTSRGAEHVEIVDYHRG